MSASLVFLSGWAHSTEVFRPLLEKLGGVKSSLLVSPSQLLVACQSDKKREERKDIGLYAQSLLALIESLPPPRIFIGWSMGGMIGLEALSGSNIAEKLILLSSACRFTSDKDYPYGNSLGALRLMKQRFLREDKPALRDFFSLVSYPGLLTEEETEFMVMNATREGKESLIGGLEYLENVDLRDKIPGVRVPTLLLHGRCDKVIPCEASHYLAAKLKDSSLVIIEEAGHDLVSSHLRAVSECISEFVDS